MRTRSGHVLVSTLVVLALGLLGAAALAGEGGYSGNPSWGLTIKSMWGSGESWSQFQIQPPGYPDGYQNGTFYDSGETFKSFAAYQFGTSWLSYINYGALDPGETIVAYGKIWSGTTNAQDKMIVGWQANRGSTGYGWNMKVFSPDWLTTLANITPDFLSEPTYGTPYPVDWEYGEFSLPILQCDRNNGYNFAITVSNPIPEPGSLLALGAGLIGLVSYHMRRRNG